MKIAVAVYLLWKSSPRGKSPLQSHTEGSPRPEGRETLPEGGRVTSRISRPGFWMQNADSELITRSPVSTMSVSLVGRVKKNLFTRSFRPVTGIICN